MSYSQSLYMVFKLTLKVDQLNEKTINAGDNLKIQVVFVHHLSNLSTFKCCNNENIYLYMAECGKNMTKSYQASFSTFWLYYETNSTGLLRSQMVEFLHFYELCWCKDLGEV